MPANPSQEMKDRLSIAYSRNRGGDIQRNATVHVRIVLRATPQGAVFCPDAQPIALA